jgi:hypothetical protein
MFWSLMYLPIASDVWSFCHEVEKKRSLHSLPASWCGPALVLIMILPASVTVGDTASSTFDQITPATKSTWCFFSISSASCLPTSGLT